MLLSVVIYNHKLTGGQWLGAAVVFCGISVEAFVKRKGASRFLNPKKLLLFIYLQMSMPSVSSRKKRKRKSNLCNIRAYIFRLHTRPINAKRRTVIHNMTSDYNDNETRGARRAEGIASCLHRVLVFSRVALHQRPFPIIHSNNADQQTLT